MKKFNGTSLSRENFTISISTAVQKQRLSSCKVSTRLYRDFNSKAFLKTKVLVWSMICCCALSFEVWEKSVVALWNTIFSKRLYVYFPSQFLNELKGFSKRRIRAMIKIINCSHHSCLSQENVINEIHSRCDVHRKFASPTCLCKMPRW